MVTLIKNGTIVNEGLSFAGSLLIEGSRISKIIRESDFDTPDKYREAVESIEAEKSVDATL